MKIKQIILVIALLLIALPLVSADTISINPKTEWKDNATNSTWASSYGNWSIVYSDDATITWKRVPWNVAGNAYRFPTTYDAVINDSSAYPYHSPTGIGFANNGGFLGDYFGIEYKFNVSGNATFSVRTNGAGLGYVFHNSTQVCFGMNDGKCNATVSFSVNSTLRFVMKGFNDASIYEMNISQINLTYLVLPALPVNITVYSPINNSIQNTSQILFNWTCGVSNTSYTSKLYIDGTLNLTNNSLANMTNQVSTFTMTIGNHTSLISCEAGASYANVTTSFTIPPYSVLSTYNAVVEELSTQTYSLNISSFINVSSMNVSFYWNNSLQNITSSVVNNFGYFNMSRLIPIIQTNSTIIPINWSYTVFYTDGTNSSNLTSNNQTIIYTSNYNITFAINISDLDTNVINLSTGFTPVNAWLWYGGVKYNATRSGNLFSYTNPTSVANNSLLWEMNLSGIIRNTTSYNQYFNVTNITSCSIGGIVYKFLSEGTTTNVLTNTSYSFTIWGTNPALTKIFNGTGTNVYNLTLCVSPLNSYSSNLNIQYGGGVYTTRYYIKNNVTITNGQATTNLYVSSNNQRETIQLINTLQQPMGNTLVEMYLNGVQLDSRITDLNGYASFDYATTNVYSFKVYNSNGVFIANTGNVLFVTNPQQIKITTGMIDSFQIDVDLTNLQYTLLNYNISKIINFSWHNNINYNKNFCLRIYNTDEDGISRTNNICVDPNVSTSIAYNYSTNNGSILATAYAVGSTHPIDQLFIPIHFSGFRLYEIWGVEALLIQCLLTIVLSLAFYHIKPSMIIFGADLSLVAGMILTLIPITFGGIIGIIVLSVVSVIAMRT